jgi:predicted nucleic acid-binding protein
LLNIRDTTFLLAQERAAISRLTAVELPLPIATPPTSTGISMEIEQATVRQFQADVFNGHLDVHPLLDSYAQAAFDLLEDMERHPLRTLDHFHLAIAIGIGAQVIATADHGACGGRLGF